jgi:hypothetical protein
VITLHVPTKPEPRNAQSEDLIAGIISSKALGCGLPALIVEILTASFSLTVDDSNTSAASIAAATPAWRSMADRRTSVDTETALVAHPSTMIWCQTPLSRSANQRKARNPITANAASVVKIRMDMDCHPSLRNRLFRPPSDVLEDLGESIIVR